MLDKNLQLGDASDNVKILQEKLKILGYYNPIITGSFGLATEEGVKAFQRDFNLEETGIVDNKMWELLLGITEPTTYGRISYPVLSIGSSGNDVRELQTKLKALLFYTGKVNSTFDLETESAVKRFQFHNDLTTTGSTNNPTWELINTLYGNLDTCVTGSVIPTTTYTVVKGDSLWSIANRFDTTVDEIKKLNNLTSNTLSIGQVLKVPSANDNTPNPTPTTYTVVRGDSLWSIANRFNTTVDEIKKLNNLTSNTISIGQVLKIPSSSNNTPSPAPTTYTVVKGDSLWSIANRFDTTVDEIKKLNNLTSNTLSIGQVLKIPSSNSNTPSPAPTTYTVVKGDSLWSIANRFDTTVDEIKRLNNLTSNTLRIGQVLKIK